MSEILTFDFLGGFAVIALLCGSCYVAGIGVAQQGRVVKGTATFLISNLAIVTAGGIAYFCANVVQLLVAIATIAIISTTSFVMLSIIVNIIGRLLGTGEDTTTHPTEHMQRIEKPTLAPIRPEPIPCGPVPERPHWAVFGSSDPHGYDDDVELEDCTEEVPMFHDEVQTAAY